MSRPPKYKTPEEMQKVIDEYFSGDAWIQGDKPMFAPTMEGLAFALGMSRQALCGYKDKDEFLDTIKEARQRVAIALEQRLYGNNVTGIIFNLKNNFGWKDKQEVESTNKHVHSIDYADLSNEELEAIIKAGEG